MGKIIIAFAAAILIFTSAYKCMAEDECPATHFVVPQNAFKRSHVQDLRPRKGAIQRACGAKSKKFKDNFSASIEFDFLSKYIWRGLDSSKGAVWQPSISAEAYGFGINIWANFPLSNEPDQGQFNEIDFVPYYVINVKNLSITPSVEIYIYPGRNPASLDYSASTTARLNLHLNYKLGKHFDIFTDVEVDVKQAPGAIWFAPGFGFHHNIYKGFGIETSISLGVGDGRFNKKHIANVGTQLNLIQYTLALPWDVWKGLTFKPIMQVTTMPAPSIRKNVNDPDKIRGGLDIIYNF